MENLKKDKTKRYVNDLRRFGYTQSQAIQARSSLIPIGLALIFLFGIAVAVLGFVVQEKSEALILVAAAVVGGFGSLPGAIVGGFTVGLFETACAFYISGSHKDAYAFLLMILVLLIKPTGFFPSLDNNQKSGAYSSIGFPPNSIPTN